MNRTLAAAIIFVCTIGSATFAATANRALATETVTFDGTWWQSLPPQFKIIAVQGMLVGYASGYAGGTWDSEIRRTEMPSYKASRKSPDITSDSIALAAAKTKARIAIENEDLAETDAEIASIQKAGGIGATLTFATIADKITAAYRDHPSLIQRLAKDFVVCAATVGDDCSSEAKDLESHPTIR
jgi:hypothetical protein